MFMNLNQMHIKMNNFIFGELIDKPCVDLERVPRKFKLSEFPYQIINITENRPLNTRSPPHTKTHTTTTCKHCCLLNVLTFFASGQEVTHRLGGQPSVLRGNRWQSSSVMKGMKGCSSRKPPSRHVYKIFLVTFLASSSDPQITGFMYSCKINILDCYHVQIFLTKILCILIVYHHNNSCPKFKPLL